ncbi:hypothetical protein HY449_00515 [Candidatus Pacearchaeota archaeon]|nr:hypothetical protein [Candidatus Pacearchaeota archaeon]
MINFLERKIFEYCLANSEFFEKIGRPLSYFLNGNDPEKVHERALELLNKYQDVVEKISPSFDFPNLHVDVAGKSVMPFGNAEGMDKNGVVLYPLSKIFGFVSIGTVPLNARGGNEKPRVFVDGRNGNVYNAQGFPSRGAKIARRNAVIYKRVKCGEKLLFSNLCGMPSSSDEKGIKNSYRELETLVRDFSRISDGIIWNPYSPNTDSLKLLRTRDVFRASAKIISDVVGKEKLKLVKMGPYDDSEEERKNWLFLVDAFLEGGGNGIVAVNTYMVPRDKVPAANWGYPSAGVSGRFLRDFRQRAICDARKNFGKDVFIIATGGIVSADEAFKSFQAGANLLSGYTPYILHGLGLIKKIAEGLETKLNELGYKTLEEFQKSKDYNSAR